MTLRKAAGDIRINGVPYRIATDENGVPLYQRKSVPKYDMRLSKSNASASENNIVEYRYSADQGFGDAVQTKNLQRYHYAGNLYMEHENEAVVMVDETQLVWEDGGVVQQLGGPAVASFEIVINENEATKLQTYILQDTFAGFINDFQAIEVQKVFEEGTPTDAVVVDNTAYVAMGSNFRHLTIISQSNSGGFPLFTTGAITESGDSATPIPHNYNAGDLIRIANCNQTAYNGIWIVSATGLTTTSFRVDALAFAALSAGTNISGTTYKIDKRYVRKFKDGVWSRDDNVYRSITAVANNGAGAARFTTSANHLYTVGTKIYLVNMSVAGYNSMSTADVSTIYTITAVASPTTFDVAAIPFTATATGSVNAQESDIHAEHFCFAGDLLIRGYKDANIGWCTSRVDPIESNPLLDANWTAGIGTVGVGDANSAITDLIALGEGEVVMKSEGVFTYKREQSAFTNEIPELNEHRHPRNGKNSVEHKGWVYVPTIIGLLRYRNGQIQNVTPGRDGQQKYMTPNLPIGGVVGDAERLYAITEPYKVYQNKRVSEARSKIYVDYDNAGSADTFAGQWADDHDIDLNGLTTNGYIYFGSTQPWHSMFVEMDDTYNTLNYNYSALRLANGTQGGQYWNGTAWTDRTLATGGFTGEGLSTQITDFTRVRDTSTKTHSTFGASGEIIFWGGVPSDWAVGGTTPLGVNLGSTDDMYWTRLKLSAAINDSVIIKRIIPGAHDERETKPYDAVDFGGVQFVLSMTEEAGKGPVWQTMWAITAVETTDAPSMLPTSVSSAGRLPPCSSVGNISIIQPNVFRGGSTGDRFLLLGGWRTVLFRLGNKQDPTESDAWATTAGFPKAFLVLPETDCGLPFTDKELREVNFDLRDIPLTAVTVYWKVDGGEWLGGVTPSSLPLKLSAHGGTVEGLRFAIAIVVDLTGEFGLYDFPYAPRFTSLPAIRVIPKPETSEYIELSVDLDADLQLRGMIDRREEKTSYAALKTLLGIVTAVEYIDVDDSIEKVHLIELGKQILFSSDQRPKAIARLVLSVFEPDSGGLD